MVHFPGLTRTDLCIQSAVTWFCQDRFPDSEIHGSKPTCGSPWLIAACHVLRRLLAPRHPPYALSSLTIKLTQHIAFAANWMITHAVTRHGPCSKFAFPHCATLEQKICGLSHQFEETHSKLVRMPASISCQRAAISANNYRLKCLPVKRSATLVWSHVACNKKPGVKRRAYPSLLQASDRGLRTEELDARFEPTRLTLPISPLDERQFRCVSDHAAFSSACRHQVILSGFCFASSTFQNYFWYASVENRAVVDNSKTPINRPVLPELVLSSLPEFLCLPSFIMEFV